MPKTHYQVLGLDPKTAVLSDIKKAYRKLALQHHPDRHPPEQKEAATEQFRSVNEAYAVLSDPTQKREYDASLAGSNTAPQFRNSRYRNDPFGQFNHVFRHDPFFRDAFRDMDDVFSRTFQAETERSMAQQQQPDRSWGRWFADWLGIEIHMSTSTTRMGPDGRPIVSTTQSHYRPPSSGQNSALSSQTHKAVQTIVDDRGRRVMIRSMERDGNKIEEHYDEDSHRLIQRLINGVPEEKKQKAVEK